MSKKRNKKPVVYYGQSDIELRASALCFMMKFKRDDVETNKMFRYEIVARRGDIVELYIEEKDMYLHLSLPDFLRCIKNYTNDNER